MLAERTVKAVLPLKWMVYGGEPLICKKTTVLSANP
jgi:hypothetical protein